jgi:hypothetical protein
MNGLRVVELLHGRRFLLNIVVFRKRDGECVIFHVVFVLFILVWTNTYSSNHFICDFFGNNNSSFFLMKPSI